MSSRRLLVCGIGSGMERSLPAIREMGLDLVVVTPTPCPLVRDLAARNVAADPRDEAAVFAAVLAENVGRVDGVLSLGFENPPIVAALARRFGCPGLNEEVALNCTLKDRRIGLLSAAGVRTPTHVVADCLVDALEALERIGFPAVVKPTDLTDSIGVAKVESAHEARTAIVESLAMSRASRIVIESFLEGTEHTLTGMCSDGVVHFGGFSDRDYSQKEKFAPAFFERGDTLPTVVDTGTIGRVQRAAEMGVHALGIDGGIFSCDVLVEPGGTVYILEIACRLTGARIATEIVPLATGIDLLPNAVRLALGDAVRPEDLQATRDRAVVQRYLPFEPGVVRSVGDLDAVERPECVYDLFWINRPTVGAALSRYRSTDDVIAGVIVEGDDPSTVEAQASMMLERVPVQFARA